MSEEIKENIPVIDIPDKKNKSKLEILADIKKMFEKNGFQIDDEKLLSLFHSVSMVQATKLPLQNKFESGKDEFEIMVFPRGKIFIEKLDKWFKLDTEFFSSMIESFKCPDLFPPFIDEQHQLGVKFGDILELKEKPEGLFAKIKLNLLGLDAVKNNKYSYISPEWGDRVDTKNIPHKNVLWAVTLTNIPAMEAGAPPLQKQIKLSKKEDRMNFREKLAKLEGKTFALEGNSEKLAGDPMAVMTELLTTLKDAITKIEELTGQKEVAEETAEKAQAELTKITEQKKAEEKEAFFESVVSKGQLEVKDIDDWRVQYDVSPAFVRKYLTSRPEKNSLQKTQTTKQTGAVSLSREDELIMTNLGYVKGDGSPDVERYKREVLSAIPKMKEE